MKSENNRAMVPIERLGHRSIVKLNMLAHILRHQSVYMSVLRRQGVSDQKALDLIQELILKILEPNFKAFPNEKKMDAWVRSSLRNAWIDSIRHDRHEVIEEPDVLESLSEHFNGEEKEYEGCPCILKLLENMSVKDREILTQLMNSENSSQLGQRKSGSAYTQAHRAKKRLLKSLVECCGSTQFKDYVNCDCDGVSG
jgi:RNA polymerase sigma factor (sigma-70 family)